MRDTFLAFGTPDFTDEEINAVNRVMRSGWIGMGPETISFEKELRTLHGSGFSIQPLFSQSAYFRFHNKSEIYKGLY